MKVLIGCGGVILKDKKILLTQRVKTKKNFPNYRTLPAGTLEDTDPTLSAAAIREIKEEVNLDFIPTKKLGFYETITDEYRIIGFVYLGNWKGEVKVLESEISNIGWFSYEETKALQIAYSYRETIEDLYNLGLLV